MEQMTRDVPFVSQSPYARNAGGGSSGFESVGPEAVAPQAPAKPPADAPVSPVQAARATDLFLRGALTPKQLEEAKASRGGFEAIVGRNNFLPAAFLEIGTGVGRATCLIRTSGTDFQGRTGSWSGTGFLLSPNVLITNHHVLNSPDVAAAATCVFNYQLGPDGKPMTTQVFRVRPDRLFLTSPAAPGGLDFTVVWVDGVPGNTFGTVLVDRKSFAIAEQEFANVISHPNGGMKMIAIQENEVQWQDDAVVHYTSDTEPGSSGASVCNNSWQLVALHHASKPSNVPNFTVLNEGIKLSAIATYLEQLAQAGGAAADSAREVLALFGGTDEKLGFFGSLGRRAAAQGDGSALERVVDSYQGTDQDIDVGFWNVEWFTRTYETKTPAVARVIHQLNLDVWSLEESSPNAAAALVKELNESYGLDFGYLAAEPDAPDGKQSATLLWNRGTVDCKREEWGEPMKTWLTADSRGFDDLGLEAVHGKIFDRYPALFRVTARQPVNGQAFSIFVVPLHLKAMAEGSTRRQMASQILAAAIRKKIEQGAGTDWVVGGDYNASLATDDFKALVGASMVPLSAQDEQGGSFSYIKGPRSLIDHIFLSPNLARKYGASDYFIVAAEKSFPRYVRDISDHRPVLVRLSLDGRPAGGDESARGGGLESIGGTEDKTAAALRELKALLGSARTAAPTATAGKAPSAAPPPAGLGFERTRASGTPEDFADREGYDPAFLGRGENLLVPLPELPSALAGQAAEVAPRASGIDRFVLAYTHFSVVMNGRRRMPFFSAANIDGTQLRRIPRVGDTWAFDPRIDRSEQVGDDVYTGTPFDRGHMTRRLDPVWGSPDEANVADLDTFHFTNACPQHKDLNRKEWAKLEDYVLGNTENHDLKVCVITGPVLADDDPPLRDVRLPEEFWKVVVMVRKDTRQLSATGYVLSQRDMATGFEATFTFGEFKTYQVTIKEIEKRTGLDFGRLRNFDPLARAKPESAGGFESVTGSGTAKEISGPGDLILK